MRTHEHKRTHTHTHTHTHVTHTHTHTHTHAHMHTHTRTHTSHTHTHWSRIVLVTCSYRVTFQLFSSSIFRNSVLRKTGILNFSKKRWKCLRVSGNTLCGKRWVVCIVRKVRGSTSLVLKYMISIINSKQMHSGFPRLRAVSGSDVTDMFIMALE